MNRVISIVTIVLISILNTLVAAASAALAVTGDGRADNAKIVFGVGCFFIVVFALLDVVRTMNGTASKLCLLAVPTSTAILILVVIAGAMLGVKGF